MIIRNGGQVLRNILVTYRLCIIFTIQIRAITKAPIIIIPKYHDSPFLICTDSIKSPTNARSHAIL